ncbi:MAG: DUF2339 domain-containing protein [Bacteroidetes bacterium]|nr:DUF2339 domain-containing protein [Bacteroidota bacterium]
MPLTQEQYDNLKNRLDQLEQRRRIWEADLNTLRIDLEAWQKAKPEAKTESPVTTTADPAGICGTPLIPESEQRPKASPAPKPSNWALTEKLIGENLINKIGILILLIGVGIGTKYAIDHNLISPVFRILSGYALGLALLAVSFRLADKLPAYSAVLFGGSMATSYLVTYAAYRYYALIPDWLAFLIMVLVTASTVAGAIRKNQVVIAHVGLVAAYAVPLLLSEGHGRVEILFTYMALLNTGILIVAWQRYWKSLLVTSVVITWLLVAQWQSGLTHGSADVWMGLGFVTLFFVIFYVVLTAYRLKQRGSFTYTDVSMILLNTLAYGLSGYGLLSLSPSGESWQGWFMILCTGFHATASIMARLRTGTDDNFHLLTTGLALTFLVLWVPVQLDGRWVAAFWAGEAVVLFLIGRSKGQSLYEGFAWPALMLSFFSTLIMWFRDYGTWDPVQASTWITPVLNRTFLVSLLVMTGFSVVTWFHFKWKERFPWSGKSLSTIASTVCTVLLALIIYGSIRAEIANWWDQLYTRSTFMVPAGTSFWTHWDESLLLKKNVILMTYTVFFLVVIGWLNHRRFKNEAVLWSYLGLSLLLILGLFTSTLEQLDQLRTLWLNTTLSRPFNQDITFLAIRYPLLAVVGVLLALVWKQAGWSRLEPASKTGLLVISHLVILGLISSELIQWMQILRVSDSDKLGLSILWGLYALLLIGLGIRKQLRPLRVLAISLIGITLLKVTFHDLADMDTIGKTIVLVVLGLLMLLMSFLYNRYRSVLFPSGGDQ